MRRRRHDSWDKPRVTAAAVIGVIAVVVIGILYFLGGGAGGPASPGTSGSGSDGATAQKTPGDGGARPAPTLVIRETTPVTVPVQGVFVKISYLGSWKGTYGMVDSPFSDADSGDRVREIEHANGTIDASFEKLDGSTRHELVVEIWKDGKAVRIGKTSDPFGKVSISYQL